ncbi:MAG: hypothetical protein CMQ05_11045 [Gammaproteobacteria bacterium]|nr:hypothetical protein [Gammaproteobacteria bacterium]RPG24564.1 MAG: hypothetical protein CBC10_010535 [Gammaproteobacteria bacterium TMED50]
MWFRIVRTVMGLLFVLSATFQINDPDPVPWVGFYLLAGCTCLFDRTQNDILLRFHVGLLLLLLAVAISGVVVLAADLGHSLDRLTSGISVTMATLAEERGREAGGLLIVGLWSLVLLIRSFHLRRLR